MTIIDESTRSAALAELERFSEQVRLLPPSDFVPAQTVMVQPGNRTFSTITAALNSITNASATQTYRVCVGAGTYVEQVICKSYVMIVGPSSGTATITYTPPENTTVVPIVTAAAFSAISYMTIIATGSPTSKILYGLSVADANPFYAEYCQINVSDGGSPQADLTGVNVRGESGVFTAVGLDHTYVSVQLTSPLTVIVFGVNVSGRLAVVQIGEGSVTTSTVPGLPVDTGGWAQNGGQIVLTSVEVNSVNAALWIENGGRIEANNCAIISGVVGPGVIVTPALAVADEGIAQAGLPGVDIPPLARSEV